MRTKPFSLEELRSEQEIISNWNGWQPGDRVLVSICCAAYNHQDFIEDAVCGFLAQETDFPYEILINEDASLDSTAKILRTFARNYPRIVKPIFHLENQYSKGIRPTIDILFSAASGEFVALCEGDDYWLSVDKLSKQIRQLQESPSASLSFCDTVVVDENGQLLREEFHCRNQELTTSDVIASWSINTASIVTYASHGLELLGRLQGLVNIDWFLQLVCSSKGKLIHQPDVLVAYRKHPTSLSQKVSKDRIKRTMRMLAMFDRFDDYSEGRFHEDINSKKRQLIEVLVEEIKRPLWKKLLSRLYLGVRSRIASVKRSNRRKV